MNWMQNTEDEIRQMTVVELDRSETQWYQPYYGIWTNSGQLSLGAVGYEFRYYEQADMKPDWDQLSAEYESTGNSYRELKDAYMAVAQEAYTEFEAGETPRLAELCRENPQEDLSHVTSFILHTLNSKAEYTMTPGLFRFNQDPVEYFLFESGQGYCQHFASAAALMYRMYGVPARYAAGYVLSPSDFEQQENGLYRAVVTDEAAHAWPEIFLENYGWTPVEVTPSAAGEPRTIRDLTALCTTRYVRRAAGVIRTGHRQKMRRRMSRKSRPAGSRAEAAQTRRSGYSHQPERGLETQSEN